MNSFQHRLIALALLCTACSDSTEPSNEPSPAPSSNDSIQITLNFNTALPPLFSYDNLPNDWSQYFFGVAFDVNSSGHVDAGDLFIAHKFSYNPNAERKSFEAAKQRSGGRAYFVASSPEFPIDVAQFDAQLTANNQLTLSIPKSNLDVYEAVQASTGVRSINYYHYGMAGSLTPESIHIEDDFPGDVDSGATTDALLSGIIYHDLQGDFLKSIGSNTLKTADESQHLSPEAIHIDLVSIEISF